MIFQSDIKNTKESSRNHKVLLNHLFLIKKISCKYTDKTLIGFFVSCDVNLRRNHKIKIENQNTQSNENFQK